MKILTTSAGAQTVKIIPREYVSTATMEIKDDQTNTNTIYNISPTTVNDDLSIGVTFDPVLVEGHYYNMTIKNSSNKVIFKDKVFCTNQTLNQNNNDYYTVNESVYTTDNTYDDDYIFI
tara:strand:+ start:503 stop:859 length:357 start_codon:yes stop_codon:yes gene_type:complete